MRKGRKSPRKMLNELKGPGAAKSVDANATWLQVLNTDKEVGAEQGSTKLVNGKYAGDDLYFLLVRWGGKMYTVSESCGRCKFPLTDAKSCGRCKFPLTDAKITSGDGGAPIMTCPLCGATYDARTGERGAIASQGGLKDAFAGMMAQKEPKDLRAYETRVTPDGAVVRVIARGTVRGSGGVRHGAR
ncbi:hypothetical protein JKP88DRAFT_346377 [Tribonema minus]|uniref:Uncharacterized protein n=1 Tax=Tribonema minus TaxID=303371 RepID=A0A835ZJ03_9STRA|nr:hypothetical protein JKP88DRAFT_346377 [Tribonema minus]